MPTYHRNSYGGLGYFHSALRKYGFAYSKWKTILLFELKGILDNPWMIIDRIFYHQKISKEPLADDPIFIIGHYRSGTTLLHRILSANHQWNYPLMFEQFFPFIPNVIRRPLQPLIQCVIGLFGIKHLMFNQYSLNIDEPVEEEMCMIGSFARGAAYWGYIFPSRAHQFLLSDSEEHDESYEFWLKKVSGRAPGKRLILKGPTNTSRIRKLIGRFPKARFVFLYRNPYDVFSATEKMWQKIEHHFSVQEITSQWRNKMIIDQYLTLMKAYHEQKSAIPANQLIEIRYEHLIENPGKVLEHIFHQFEISPDESSWLQMNHRIEKEMNYAPSKYEYSPEQLNFIQTHWGTYIKQWNYSLPCS